MMPGKESVGKMSMGVRTDRVGKLFLVLKEGMRRCLICDEVFTNQEAAKHSQLLCGPADPHATFNECARAELSE